MIIEETKSKDGKPHRFTGVFLPLLRYAFTALFTRKKFDVCAVFLAHAEMTAEKDGLVCTLRGYHSGNPMKIHLIVSQVKSNIEKELKRRGMEPCECGAYHPGGISDHDMPQELKDLIEAVTGRRLGDDKPKVH